VSVAFRVTTYRPAGHDEGTHLGTARAGPDDGAATHFHGLGVHLIQRRGREERVRESHGGATRLHGLGVHLDAEVALQVLADQRVQVVVFQQLRRERLA